MGPSPSTVICWSCGHADQDAGDGCLRCGARRRQVPDAPPPATRCPACGSLAAAAAQRSCPSCGLPFPAPPHVATVTPSPSGRRRWAVGLAAAVAAVAAVAVVVLVLVVRNGAPGLEARWRLQAGGAVVGAAEVDGGTLFVATRDGALVAVEADSGEPRWRFETGERALVPPVAEGGLVYLATEATPASDPASGSAAVHLFAVDARTGNEQWRADLELPLGGPVAVAAGLVLAPVGDVVALDALTGEERWRRPVGSGAEALTADATTVVARSPGALVALDPATGAERWTVATTGATPVAPVISAGTLVVGDGDGAVVGRDPDDGAERWRVPGVALAQPPVAAGDVLAMATTDGVVALDSASGERRWEVGLDGADEDDGVRVATDGAAVATTSAGRLTLFDAVTGEVLGQADLAGEARATPAVAAGRVYIAEGATVAAFDRPAG